MRLRSPVAFPLLGKELIELAAKPRTYVVRTLVALGLLAAFLVSVEAAMPNAHPVTGLIGRGGAMLRSLLDAVLLALMAIAPAGGAIAIAAERERGSLSALLLTPMSPLSLVLQKWLSRQVPLLSLVALCLPLFAICYAFGGVDDPFILIGAYALALAALQSTAIGLAVGAWCRSVTVAVIVAYVASAVVVAALPLLQLWDGHHYPYGSLGYGYQDNDLTSLDPLGVLRAFSGSRADADALAETFAGSWPALSLIPLCLLVARLGVTRAVESRMVPPVLRVFLALDRWFVRAEARIGRRVARDLPGADPVAWREINRRALANTRYLVRLGLPIAAAVLGLCVLIGSDWHRSRDGSFTLVYDATVALGAVVMLGLAIPIVDGERSRQTLDVLLTTPLSGRAIIAQKQRALRRLHVLIAFLPLLVVGWSAYVEQEVPLQTLVIEAGTALLLPAAVANIGAASGIFVRGRGRAAGVAAAVIAIWLVLPMLAGPVLLALGIGVQMSQNRWYPQATHELEVAQRLLIPTESISPYGLLVHARGITHNAWYYQEEIDWWRVVAYGLGAQAAVWIAARATIALAADRALRRGAARA